MYVIRDERGVAVAQARTKAAAHRFTRRANRASGSVRPMLRLGPASVDDKATASLTRVRIVAKNKGDLSSAVVSAAHYARKTGETMWVYAGNSFGHAVWRVSHRPGDYLDPINNTGSVVLSVTPGLVVSQHPVVR